MGKHSTSYYLRDYHAVFKIQVNFKKKSVKPMVIYVANDWYVSIVWYQKRLHNEGWPRDSYQVFFFDLRTKEGWVDNGVYSLQVIGVSDEYATTHIFDFVSKGSSESPRFWEFPGPIEQYEREGKTDAED